MCLPNLPKKHSPLIVVEVHSKWFPKLLAVPLASELNRDIAICVEGHSTKIKFDPCVPDKPKRPESHSVLIFLIFETFFFAELAAYFLPSKFQSFNRQLFENGDKWRLLFSIWLLD